jgi:formylglycine-generating enzyme required for sulfatase activity
VASFTATPTSGSAPLTVQFTDTSTQSPLWWLWDFDNDGVFDSAQQNPSWTYTQNGIYSVRLVVANFLGSSSVTRLNLVQMGVPPVNPNPALNMVPIAPGTFQMGSMAGNPDEQPVRQVTLTAPFWMGKYEVTQAEYQTVMGSNPSSFQGAQRPVETVSWNSAVAYCQALTAIEQAAGRVPQGYQYRLPTEAEWEYCCRAGTTTEWNTGTSLSTSQANFLGVLGQTAVAGTYAPNAFGLHDMHGNVWEWCLDTYASYAPGPVTGPFVTGGPDRVIRGGSWSIIYGSSAFLCRSANRGFNTPGFSSNFFGFRVVLAPVLVP